MILGNLKVVNDNSPKLFYSLWMVKPPDIDSFSTKEFIAFANQQ